MKKTRLEKFLSWSPTVIVLAGGIFSTGMFYQVVQAHEKKIDTLEDAVKKMATISAEQHTTQQVQATQMKWIVDELKKKQREIN